MRRTELMRRLGWSAWALVPVALLAFHFGPGKTLAAREIAATRFREASELERQAIELQAEAYRAHLETIERRREAFLDGDEVDESPDEDADAIAADDRERIAYEAASTAWASVADAYAQVEERLVDDDPRTIDRIRWSKARALVRSGAIWDGVVDLETLVVPRSDGPRDVELARAAREELATAHYFGARLLRMAGEPARVWRAEAIKARQHFRLLAETAAASGAEATVVRGLEDNVERTIDLEQMDKSELEGRALPRESPRGTRGRRPGQGQEGVSQRPPTRRDGRGAGGPGPIGPGW
ncbi:MAG: hypothetical protein GWP75_10705 [Planctomycetia bacterium]|jgi:hypothetical protein|nr:hypothetical protein [Planctomycetia bacterium]